MNPKKIRPPRPCKPGSLGRASPEAWAARALGRATQAT